METKQDQNLFYNKETKTYYYKNLFKGCDYCGRQISNLIFIKLGFTGKELNKNYYCKSCFQNQITFNKLNVSEEVRIALVTEELPKKSILIIDAPPDFSNAKGYDVFNMADHNREGEKTKDKTIYAGRDSLEGATIGDPKFINSDKDKTLSQEEIFKELKQIKNAILEVTNETEKKQLTNLGGLHENRRERKASKKVKWTNKSKKTKSKEKKR